MGIENIRLGTSEVSLNGNDLGYTQGGVSITISTTMRETVIDHFGTIERRSIVQDQSAAVSFKLVESQKSNLLALAGGQIGSQVGQSLRVGSMTFAAKGISYSFGDMDITSITIAGQNDAELSYAFEGKASLVTSTMSIG